ncbi:MAG: response regulator transcription factor [Propionibacteriaceae bacterium]|jgi:DNA-binding response OmpR family regulator|nr:response regulator transcription factor [Propionibacteriaceae bacterium]
MVTTTVVPRPSRVLIVDDERALAQVLGSYLVKAGYEVHYAVDGPSSVSAARELDPEVILLDLGLPGLDGLEVCRQVRTFSDCYILMITARDDETDRIIGLGVGADDYIGKPFSPREVVARVSAVLRRPRPSKASAAEGPTEERIFGEVRIDPVSREVWVGERKVALTRTEFDILDVLSRQPKAALTRRQIIDQVWNTEWVGDDHVVNVHVGNLRRKLGDDPNEPEFLLTVRGIGYRMGLPPGPSR